jgi:hypothetical protein
MLAVFLTKRVPPDWLRVYAGTAMLVVCALALFYLKRVWLQAYAIVEIAFAAVVATNTMRELKNVIEPIEGLGLLGAMYLLVSGFENLREARREAKEKPPEGG